MTIKISKQQLVEVLTSWGHGKASTAKLQHWMLDNFEPDEFIIGEGESEETVEAMHIVMNEYEIVDEAKCIVNQFQLAIDFINANEVNFLTARNLFLKHAFCD